MSAEIDNRPDDPTCKRCGCCEVVWVDCNECAGEGEHGSACIDDMCHGQDECMHGDRELLRCQICEGKGGWDLCGGDCCDHGKHEQAPGCTDRCVNQREIHSHEW